MPRPISNASLIVGAVLALAAAAGMFAFGSQPLDSVTWVAARWLRLHGFSELDVPGPRGPIRVYEGGEGPPLVLVHGFGDRAMGWRSVLMPLSGDFRVIAPDLAGHGESAPPPSEPLSLADTLESLRCVIEDRAPGEPVVLVGNSMGGWLSALYAIERPDRVARLVLVNSAGLRWPLKRADLLPSTREGVQHELELLFGPAAPWLPDFVIDDLIELHEGKGLQTLFDTMRSQDDLDDRLARLEVPTTIVWGTEDGLFPEELARRWHEAVPGSQLRWLSGCAHVPQVTCPGRFLEVLGDALAPSEPGVAKLGLE